VPKHDGDQGGRPTVFTKEKAQKVFDQMCNGTSAVKAVYNSDITWQTWCRWLYNDDENPTPEDDWLRISYARARKACIDYWFWNGHETAHDDSKDLQPYKKYYKGQLVEEGVRSDNTPVNRARLKVDTDFKIASRMFPADYGETVKQEISGKGGADIVPVMNVTILSPDK